MVRRGEDLTNVQPCYHTFNERQILGMRTLDLSDSAKADKYRGPTTSVSIQSLWPSYWCCIHFHGAGILVNSLFVRLDLCSQQQSRLTPCTDLSKYPVRYNSTQF